MIEATIIQYLTAQDLPGIGAHIYGETPAENIPENYVLIRRTGGSMANYIRQYNIYTETVGKDRLTTLQNHEAVVSAMLAIRDHTDIMSCRLNSDYDATNTRTKEYRYQALWQITE